MHNEVSRRGLNGDSAPARGRARVLFCWRLRCRCGSRSVRDPNKRTVGRFSFCGLSLRDPRSLPVSLFRGGGGGGSESARYPSAMYRSPSITLSKRASRELFLSRLLARRSRRCLPVRRTVELSFHRYRGSVSSLLDGKRRRRDIGKRAKLRATNCSRRDTSNCPPYWRTRSRSVRIDASLFSLSLFGRSVEKGKPRNVGYSAANKDCNLPR